MVTRLFVLFNLPHDRKRSNRVNSCYGVKLKNNSPFIWINFNCNSCLSLYFCSKRTGRPIYFRRLVHAKKRKIMDIRHVISWTEGRTHRLPLNSYILCFLSTITTLLLKAWFQNWNIRTKCNIKCSIAFERRKHA